MKENHEEIIDAILEKTLKDDEKEKLLCASALKIAEQFGVKPLEIGRICNQKKIRIIHCQLGCFK